MKDIKLLRLTSGEELIATVDESGKETEIVITDAIIMIPAGEGKIGFMPFMPYTKAEKGLVLKRENVMFMVDPVPALVDQFKQAKSGIVTPPQGVIV
jgi:hypothetical protein